MNTVATTTRPALLRPTLALWRREMVRFFRQRSRVVGAVAMPLILWILIGSGLSGDFMVGGASDTGVSYLQYFFPGTVVFMVLNTAIYSTISVIEDRREGFLQGVLVAPIGRLSIVMGKVLGGASIATIQGAIILCLWPLVGAWPGFGWMLASLLMLFLLALGLTALGLCIAWPMDSTAAFHGVMMVGLMPMWFLSGAVFPVATAPLWLRTIMLANPLTYGQAAFAYTLTGGSRSMALSPTGGPVPFGIALGATILAAAIVIAFAAKLVATPRKDGLA